MNETSSFRVNPVILEHFGILYFRMHFFKIICLQTARERKETIMYEGNE